VKTQEGQDQHDNYNKADKVDYAVHGCVPRVKSALLNVAESRTKNTETSRLFPARFRPRATADVRHPQEPSSAIDALPPTQPKAAAKGEPGVH
jgi:hypothetical protein